MKHGAGESITGHQNKRKVFVTAYDLKTLLMTLGLSFISEIQHVTMILSTSCFLALTSFELTFPQG